ncbi:hypothetical protein [Bosea sp. (in: a-proteobacteria)]
MERPLRATHHCRHYSYERDRRGILLGCDGGGPLCARGVDLRSDPGATRACMPAELSDGQSRRVVDPCDLREDYTDPERAAWSAWREESTRRMLVICAAIPAEGFDGSLPCPGCGAGTVRWSRALSNRHLQVACSTPNCFSVIQ